MAAMQEDIVREVETGAAAKVFDLSLPELGPYSMDFTRSGKHVALAGRKGHLAVLDWKQARLVTEIQVDRILRIRRYLCQMVVTAWKKGGGEKSPFNATPGGIYTTGLSYKEPKKRPASMGLSHMRAILRSKFSQL